MLMCLLVTVLIELLGIERLHRCERHFVQPPVSASLAKWFMSLEITSSGGSGMPSMTFARPVGELAAARQVAAADGNADDLAIAAPGGRERQLDFDGVLLRVGGGVELQARESPGTSWRASSGSLASVAPGIDQVSCGATAHSTPCGVCLGPMTMIVEGNLTRDSVWPAMRPE